jgi:hypothetical protein
MHLIGASILIQILCAVHCVRSGRNSMWLMVIIFLSIPGCLAYFLFEIAPGLGLNREVRAAKAAAARRLDPERPLRAAREALELADTAASRTALADALVAAGKQAEAAGHYRAALDKIRGDGDRGTRIKLASALLESSDCAGARTILEALPSSASAAENDRAALLLARALEECGETEQALGLYAGLGRRMAGGEALCRQAALLLKEGRGQEAMAPLTEIEALVKRLDRVARAERGDMYGWATRTLAELRGGA